MNKVRLEDLRGSMCRWPHGDPKDQDFHFCGARSEPGRAYCDEHEQRARRSTASLERERREAEARQEKQAA